MASETRVSHRVLIVDDCLDNVLSSAVLLLQVRHEVHAAYDGLQALELAELHRPRVILLDIGLPGLNGYEVAQRIRQEPWGSDVVLIAVTGQADSDINDKCQAAGIDYTFIKPACPTELLQLLWQIPSKAQVILSEVHAEALSGICGSTPATPDVPHDCKTTQAASSS